jgi:hypothetical protein
VTFVGATSFNITKGGQGFYNIQFNNAAGAWRLANNLTVDNNFTLTNGTFDTSSSNYAVTVSSSIYINGGSFLANASQISVGANFDVTASDLFTSGSSTITLTGSGYIRAPGYGNRPNNLSMAAAGQTTYNYGIYIDGLVTLSGKRCWIGGGYSWMAFGSGSSARRSLAGVLRPTKQ